MSFSSKPNFYIRSAASPEDLKSISDCFSAYAQWLDLDLTFQDFATELSTLPGKYAPPKGALLLARDLATDEVLGCIAMRPIELQPEFRINRAPDIKYCELKRLYVYPSARGRNIAKKLVTEVLRLAREQGYHEALLDTLDSMKAAIALYRSLGFKETERYYPNPQTGGFVNMSKEVQ